MTVVFTEKRKHGRLGSPSNAMADSNEHMHLRESSSTSKVVTPRSASEDTGAERTGPGKHHVLIVDDDIALGKFLSRELKLKSYVVQVESDGKQACGELIRGSFDLVILDMNLPGTDGIAVMKQMRLTHPRIPILVLTARNRTQDLVQVLEQGADDCLVKPFSFLELRARMKNLLRRHAGISPQASHVGDLILNRDERRVSRKGRKIDLTPREFSILECLMTNVGKPVSRMTLMREVWNIPFDPTTNIVDVYMKYLRDKINDAGEAKLIRTVRGVGYVLSHD